MQTSVHNRVHGSSQFCECKPFNRRWITEYCLQGNCNKTKITNLKLKYHKLKAFIELKEKHFNVYITHLINRNMV